MKVKNLVAEGFTRRTRWCWIRYGVGWLPPSWVGCFYSFFGVLIRETLWDGYICHPLLVFSTCLRSPITRFHPLGMAFAFASFPSIRFFHDIIENHGICIPFIGRHSTHSPLLESISRHGQWMPRQRAPARALSFRLQACSSLLLLARFRLVYSWRFFEEKRGTAHPLAQQHYGAHRLGTISGNSSEFISSNEGMPNGEKMFSWRRELVPCLIN